MLIIFVRYAVMHMRLVTMHLWVMPLRSQYGMISLGRGGRLLFLILMIGGPGYLNTIMRLLKKLFVFYGPYGQGGIILYGTTLLDVHHRLFVIVLALLRNGGLRIRRLNCRIMAIRQLPAGDVHRLSGLSATLIRVYLIQAMSLVMGTF